MVETFVYFIKIFVTSEIQNGRHQLVYLSQKNFQISLTIIQRASEASEADYQSCSIEISDMYIYICMYMYTYVKIFCPRF